MMFFCFAPFYFISIITPKIFLLIDQIKQKTEPIGSLCQVSKAECPIRDLQIQFHILNNSI